jgi:geranyl-CoA carboxylase alpha subunit
VDANAEAFDVHLHQIDGPRVDYVWRGVRRHAWIMQCGNETHVDLGNGPIRIEDITQQPPQAHEGQGSGLLKAPMDGAVTAIMAMPGDTVKKGQTILVVEAMKMEHLVKADLDGVVAEILVQKGQQVKGKQRIGTLRQHD